MGLGTATASATGSISILNVAYQVDTLAHMKVGPGTTTTYLRLKSASSQLQVHYLTIDKTTPNVAIRAVSGTDKVAGTERVSSMASRKSGSNVLYFGGCNADFFTTSGTATNGSTKVGSPTTSCTVDGEIYKTSNSQYQFSIDADNVARIGRLNYYTGTATIGDKVTLFKGVNVASPNNGITIYTSKYWGSTNQTDKAGSCYEVTAKLVEGDSFTAGHKFRLEVTSDATSTGDTTIPAGGYVIHGRGTSKTGCNTGALSFVEALKVGDIVEFDNIILLDDQRIYPTQIVSGNPKNVGGGETLDTESERTDASALHPRTCIGISQTGDSIIMMVVEGRHTGSAGVRTSQLADIMRYAGGYEAVNLDGGGSSTLYTSAFGVRNYCSDGNERAVGNGIFATVNAPSSDKTITEIQFADWAPRVPKYGHYTPRLLGFNQYGVLVNDSITDYQLSCPAELGDIVDGITLNVTGDGTHALTATVGSISANVAVTVDSNCQFSPRLTDILIDNKRQYAIELQANNGVKVIPVDSQALTWSSSDAAVATVTAEGVVTGVADGTATITGTVGDDSVTVNVTVEIAKSAKTNLISGFSLDNWKFAKTGCTTETAIQPTDDGATITYGVSSTRGLALTISPINDLYLWSLPDAIEVQVTPTTTALKSVNVKFNDNAGGRYSATGSAVAAGENGLFTVNIADYSDVADIAVYPIKFASATFTPDGKAGDTGTVAISAINAVYGASTGINAPQTAADEATDAPAVYYNLQGIRISRPASGLYIESRGGRAVKKIAR